MRSPRWLSVFKRSVRRPPQLRRGLSSFRPTVEGLENRELLNGAGLSQNALVASYGQIPLSFEANHGQTDAQVQYLARGPGYGLFLTGGGAVLGLSAEDDALAREMVSVQLVGADPEAEAAALDRLPGTTNYLLGDDPAGWLTELPTYGRVSYDDVYPGIDLVYYGNQQQLEYDFVVAPGADPGQIRLAFAGADDMALDADGDLILRTAHGDLVQRAPVLYQEADGGRQAVSGQFVLEGGTVRFEVGAYDASRPLVIDPVLVYSTYLGGNSFDEGAAIAVDTAGNAYVTGRTFSSNFPTVGPFQATLASFQDAFVAKVNASGTALLYATYLGGNSSDEGRGLAVDQAGNVYVAGNTNSSNFPTVNPFQGTPKDFYDSFVAKLNPAGSALVYASYFGGNSYDELTGLARGVDGSVYLTGRTFSNDLATANAAQTSRVGFNDDAFAAKVSIDGSTLVYATYLGGDSADQGRGIVADQAGNAYVTGYTFSGNFPNINALQTANAGSYDGFVVKLNPTGSAFVFATYLGGTGDDQAAAIALDATENVYVSGQTGSANFATGASAQQYGGGTDAFVAKLSASGASLAYFTYLGGSSFDEGRGIAVDQAGNAVVTGQTYSANFPTANTFPETRGSSPDAFVTRLSADGSAFLYSTYLGGGSTDVGNAVALDPLGNTYVVGSTYSNDFPIEVPLQAVRGSSFDSDLFLAKIDFNQIAVGRLQFRATSFQAPETAGNLVVAVTRARGVEGTVRVNFATSDGTAHAGTHYTATSGTLTFAAGETLKTFTVPILDDPNTTGNFTVNLALSNPTDGATLGAAASAVLTIVDARANDNRLFVTNLFSDLLGRAADANGLFNWQRILDLARLSSMVSLAREFVTSLEVRTNLIRGYYLKYLGRMASSSEVGIWLGVLQRFNTSLEDVIAGFLASEEYFLANGSDNAMWLDRAYQDVLGHGRDSGWNFLLDQLQRNIPRDQVGRALLNREEYRDALIRATYAAYLNRQPDTAEVEFWRDRIGGNDFGSPTQDERFLAEVLASREFVQTAGDSGPAWVSRLYARVLARAADADEFTFWFNRLQNAYAFTRQQVVQGFTGSDEYRGRLIETTFQQLLGRPAQPGELTFFRNFRTEALRATLVASDEYFQRQGMSNQAWLDKAYLDLLGRARGSDGATDLAGLNNQTRTRPEVADALVHGDEYRRRVVTGFFTTFLGRPANAGELAFGLERFRFGFTEERVLAEVLNSTEYFLSL